MGDGKGVTSCHPKRDAYIKERLLSARVSFLEVVGSSLKGITNVDGPWNMTSVNEYKAYRYIYIPLFYFLNILDDRLIAGSSENFTPAVLVIHDRLFY